jgi:RimJ/RimL family protein N-acetyltransferase
MFIRSERLFLRPSWPEDWVELLPRIRDQEIVCNLARAPWPYQPGDARAFAGRSQDRRFPHFVVTLPGAEGPKLIGACGLNPEDGEAELGYWIAREHWGRGYAPEAARAVLRLARALGHRRIVASHFVDNPASARVLAKVGFQPTGEVRPRFSLARGGEALTAFHTIELGAAADCDGSGGDAPGSGMRVA